MCVIVHNFRVIHADSGGSGALHGGEKFFEPHLHYSKCRDSSGKHFSYLIPEVSVCSECVLYCTVLYCTVYCTVQGVYWRHENQLLSSSGLVTVSPLSRRTNTTFAISLSVWLTSTQQSGEYHC